MTRARRLLVVASSGLIVFGALMVVAPATRAAPCGGVEEFIFRKAHLVTNAKGNLQTIKTRDQVLAACDDAEFHSTTHIVNTDLLRFVEVGWNEVWIGNIHEWQAFWEAYDGLVYYGDAYDGPVVACCLYMGWKVWEQPGTNRWKYWIDTNGDGTFTQIGPLYGSDVGFSAGLAEGESGRHGGTGTGDYDHHEVMRYNTVGGDTGWKSWNGNDLDMGSIAGYHYHYLGLASYEIIHD
jgi:hypothetical protein